MSTRMSSGPSIARDRRDVRTRVSSALGFGHAKASYRLRRLSRTCQLYERWAGWIVLTQATTSLPERFGCSLRTTYARRWRLGGL